MQTNTGRAPYLDGKLTELKRAMTRQLWMHGVGTTVLATAAWFAFTFMADWLLHLPAPIRLIHTGILIALPIWLTRRELLSHMRRLPDRAGLAQLIERHHPQSQDLFVSAVQLEAQLDDESTDEGRGALIQRVVAQAEAHARSVELAPVLERGGPRKRALGGFAAFAIVAMAMVNTPELSGIFFSRLFGADVAWPQRTHLTIEIPAVGEQVRVDVAGDDIQLRVARGSDVPVLVHAEGVVPDEVVLHFDSGHRVILTSGGTSLFRTRLPAVQENTSFHATGGDDTDGAQRVHLTVLRPPDVSAIVVSIEPPAYSGLPTRTELQGDVEVLEGSRLTVHVLPDPSDATGVARMLPADIEHTLESMPFPDVTNGSQQDAATSPISGLGFSLQAEASARYRFELTDDSGLPNPDPGLYAIEVVEDSRPELVLVAPSRAEVDVVMGGALALRVRVHDDFGIANVFWSTRLSLESEEFAVRRELSLHEVQPEEEARLSSRETLASHTRIEVADLFARNAFAVDPGTDAAEVNAAAAEGATLVLQLEATDNKEPMAGTSLSTPIKLRVVSQDEFLRRLQDTLARTGEMAARLSRLEEQRLVRSQELMAAFAGEDAEVTGNAELNLLLSDLRRVQGDARALTRDLASITENLLYARADDRAGKLLDLLDEQLAATIDRSFHPEPWLALTSAYEGGEAGHAGLAGQLVEIVGLALAISEDASMMSISSLESVAASTSPAEMRQALTNSITSQTTAIDTTNRLLERLAEWDNLNSILTLTRDILNGQKNLTERTRQHAKDN
ncbi:MAG: hypothetical protein ACI841_000858 [Planctomycetota bacterium]|jgi:hypothetical protein